MQNSSVIYNKFRLCNLCTVLLELSMIKYIPKLSYILKQFFSAVYFQIKILNIKCASISDPDDIIGGSFIIVNVKNKKNLSYRYVAVCSTALEDNGEVEVTFLKRAGDQHNTFKIDENDVSYVHYTDIIGVLTPPNLVIKGDRLYYNFDNDVDVHQ